MEALDQRSTDQSPPIHQHKEDQFERQRYDRWRQHHHAHTHQDTGHHQIDHQERDEQQEADLEGTLQLADHEGGRQHVQRRVGAGLRLVDLGQANEQAKVFVVDLTEHEGLDRG